MSRDNFENRFPDYYKNKIKTYKNVFLKTLF